ncbi:hypothetical protein SNE40_022547 [Patella caerulea]|uniref:Mitochondrial GTPase 1 n=1 Tax=Patella caerulea TaxID=87958 RepID=A0AAN8G0L4_PATCE
MSSRIYQITKPFRKTFEVANQEALRWFPGHMFKSMERMHAILKDVDCVIEVHDAKIPFSGRNPRFRDIISLRPHLLLLNKIDLADINAERRLSVENKLKSQGVDTIFYTDLRNYEKSLILKKEILPSAINLIESRPRYERTGLKEYNVMVIGVPNVGKSTFINAVRWSHIKKKGKATKVGAVAGVTRSVLTKIKVHTDPVTFIIDTPGILTPKIPTVDVGMKLAVCGCIPDHFIGQDNVVDYLLYWFNKHQRFEYVEKYGLIEPTDSVTEFLTQVAIKSKKVKKILDPDTNQYRYLPDFIAAAVIVLKDFREGALGVYFLDDNQLK